MMFFPLTSSYMHPLTLAQHIFTVRIVLLGNQNNSRRHVFSVITANSFAEKRQPKRRSAKLNNFAVCVGVRSEKSFNES